MRMTYRNKYTALIIQGHLSAWTGPNPDKDPNALKDALERAAREPKKPCYPVIVTEILPSDVEDICLY
jgi:hypothetical protein